MKRQVTKVISLMLIFTLLLSGCAKKSATTGDKSTTDDTPKAKAEEITVMVWDRGNAVKGTTVEENASTKWIQTRTGSS